MKNGFTLVELLGVIIILAVIVAIATPVVTKTIKKSKDTTLLYSAQLYIDAVEKAVFEKNLNESFKPSECIVNTSGSLICDDIVLGIDADGEKPDRGKISFKSREVSYAFLAYGEKTLYMQQTGKFILLKEPKSFAEDSWDTIAANVRAGNLSVYKLGDTKEIALTGFTNEEENSNGLYTIRIANTSTPEECKTEGFSQTACGFVIEFEDIITTHNMNPTGEYKGVQYNSGWNVDGYPASSMYRYIQNDIYNALPEELKTNIIDTYVVSGHGSTSGENNFTSTDKLYLLSGKEVHGSDSFDTSADLTRQLDYYSDLGITTSSSSGAIKKYNGSAKRWWLRSASSNLIRYFRYVANDGYLYGHPANNSFGVAVALRIG